ncbi:unnamed protein product [Echinostoma caproni]|uniref:Acetoacetyl-CoA synthetase n=1 Tax=Echinostoma caproni TaxID=27848 RepID=A0A183A7Z8_9TREM|nr:unnamed protein product [Echinostoma caproni]
MSEVLWKPNEDFVRKTSMFDFMQFVERRHQNKVLFHGDYRRLHAWSVANINEFWMDFFTYCELRYSVPPTKAIDTGVSMDSKPVWFPGCFTNYAENLLLGGQPNDIAIYSCLEEQYLVPCLTYGQLTEQVNAAAHGLRSLGVVAGSRVAGLLPNCIEAVVCYLAASSIGAIWSSASPDFGAKGIIQRFELVQPTVLFTVTQTIYRGKTFDQLEKVRDLVQALNPKPVRVVFVPFLQMLCTDLYSNGDAISTRTTDKNGVDSKQIGWMMWNWLVSAVALGSSVVLYEGCPFATNLWDLIDGLSITTLGTSAKWLAVCEERALKPGGTDILGCCVGCCPVLPVYRGRIQCRLLGMAVESWDEDGKPHTDRKGELVIVRPFPSMPVGFWNDPGDSKYRDAYFAKFPHIWSHGDFIELHSETETLTISGRSDTTLNPSGIRFGSAEIYNLIEGLPGVLDSLCVAQSNADRSDERMILLVKLSDNSIPDGPLPTELATTIQQAIRSQLSPRFLPAVMCCVSAIPSQGVSMGWYCARKDCRAGLLQRKRNRQHRIRNLSSPCVGPKITRPIGRMVQPQQATWYLPG